LALFFPTPSYSIRGRAESKARKPNKREIERGVGWVSATVAASTLYVLASPESFWWSIFFLGRGGSLMPGYVSRET
jgi:hypothetical protein